MEHDVINRNDFECAFVEVELLEARDEVPSAEKSAENWDAAASMARCDQSRFM